MLERSYATDYDQLVVIKLKFVLFVTVAIEAGFLWDLLLTVQLQKVVPAPFITSCLDYCCWRFFYSHECLQI